jgi:polyferredoxin
MTAVYLIPIVLSSLLLGAHFFRSSNIGLTLLCVFAPLALLIRRFWIIRAFQLTLIVGGLIWIYTAYNIMQWRISAGQPWIRTAVILGAVALFTIGSAYAFEINKVKAKYRNGALSYFPSLFAFILTAALLGIAQMIVKPPLILLERFFRGGGWLEIFGLSVYAGFITEKMLDISQSAKWRHRVWIIFSAVFFGQLILGLIGFDKFLMTGKLHLPIPALIAAGPIYRGENFLMPILFIATIILVGPAWCSHLCYIGAWDDIASRARKKPGKMPSWRQPVRVAILFAVVATAILLRAFGVSTAAAGVVAMIFGLVGVAIIILWSRMAGVMAHCVAYCPIGPLANWLGKISPFRIKINDTACNDCAICHTACRYDALNLVDIKKRKPNISCTLCGDCLGACKDDSIEFHFLGIKGRSARHLFIVLIVSIHAVFMGVARM